MSSRNLLRTLVISCSGRIFRADSVEPDLLTYDVDVASFSALSKVSSAPGVEASTILVMFYGNMIYLNSSIVAIDFALHVSKSSLICSSGISRQFLRFPSSDFLKASLNFLSIVWFALYLNMTFSSCTTKSYASFSFSLRKSKTSSPVISKPVNSTSCRFSLNDSIYST